MSRRLVDPTEARRRRRARHRLRELAARNNADRGPIVLTPWTRVGVLALGLIVVGMGAAIAYVGLGRITVPAIGGLVGVCGILLILPGLGLVAAAVLPPRVGVRILEWLLTAVELILSVASYGHW